jgi:hypothetical protein
MANRFSSFCFISLIDKSTIRFREKYRRQTNTHKYVMKTNENINGQWKKNGKSTINFISFDYKKERSEATGATATTTKKL